MESVESQPAPAENNVIFIKAWLQDKKFAEKHRIIDEAKERFGPLGVPPVLRLITCGENIDEQAVYFYNDDLSM